MTDKELLELAAKAAGIKIKPMQVNNVTKQGDNQFIGYMTDIEQWPRGWFNPLTNDGDALRLAVSIGMEVTIKKDRTEAMIVGDSYYEHVVHNGDKNLATRKAIVLCAANYAEKKS